MKSSFLARILSLAALTCQATGYNVITPGGRRHSKLHAVITHDTDIVIVGRCNAFHSILGGAAAFAFVAMPKIATALDIDAFANAEVSK
jgi:hypothetical protein